MNFVELYCIGKPGLLRLGLINNFAMFLRKRTRTQEHDLVMMKTRLKQLYSYLLIVLIFALISACAAPKHHILQTEKDYQEAFNRVYFQGHAQMEVPVNYGRIDLLTADYAIEVERIDKFHEGIGQALHYAKETGRKPGLAVFITDPTEHELEKLKYVRKLCQSLGIKVWYINEELEKAQKKK